MTTVLSTVSAIAIDPAGCVVTTPGCRGNASLAQTNKTSNEAQDDERVVSLLPLKRHVITPNPFAICLILKDQMWLFRLIVWYIICQ